MQQIQCLVELNPPSKQQHQQNIAEERRAAPCHYRKKFANVNASLRPFSIFFILLLNYKSTVNLLDYKQAFQKYKLNSSAKWSNLKKKYIKKLNTANENKWWHTRFCSASYDCGNPSVVSVRFRWVLLSQKAAINQASLAGIVDWTVRRHHELRLWPTFLIINSRRVSIHDIPTLPSLLTFCLLCIWVAYWFVFLLVTQKIVAMKAHSDAIWINILVCSVNSGEWWPGQYLIR